MAKIIVTGVYFTNRITIEVTGENEKLLLTVFGDKSQELEKHLKECIKRQPAMGGTYYPEHDSMLAAYNVLNTIFFDSLEEITIKGDIGTIPYEEGKIY